ncbi:hypothetical protein DFP72DRAFT_232194 [Ephemerocybe angulata]|uniref:Secreted protein n=1 Tax=Ephemerocybe angulata TaxID=980116 RepID=A0A8H6M6A6_9AGAR|nr:hypothetical protein DFP72DRAFT_232194 [Tulosesus angulatus]
MSQRIANITFIILLFIPVPCPKAPTEVPQADNHSIVPTITYRHHKIPARSETSRWLSEHPSQSSPRYIFLSSAPQL